MFIAGLIVYYCSVDSEEIGISLGGVGLVVSVILLIAILIVGIQVSSFSVIDEKIEMYQTENAKIEAQVAQIVEQYQKYESETFDKVSPENSITYVTLYPELKSDELVKSQIAVYVENNQMIKTLKEQQISASVYRWWLYFGK